MEIFGGLVAGLIIGYAFNYFNYLRPIVKIPPLVKRVGPDEFTFSHNTDSPIWIEFDTNMDKDTINNDTVVVKAYPNGNETQVNGTIAKSSRVLMFRPEESYPRGTGDTVVIITLIGSDTGSGSIKNVRGVSLDGDGDGKEGGDFEYMFIILG